MQIVYDSHAGPGMYADRPSYSSANLTTANLTTAKTNEFYLIV